MRRHILLAATMLVTACRDPRVLQPTLALPQLGEQVPAFILTRLDGGRTASSELRGTPTVLFLWSTHCATSRHALSEYRAIQAAYADRATVALLADDESTADLERLPRVLSDSSIVGPIVLARGRMRELFDRSRTAPERDTAHIEFVLPAYLVLDQDGRIVARSWGPGARLVREALDRMLSQPHAARAQDSTM